MNVVSIAQGVRDQLESMLPGWNMVKGRDAITRIFLFDDFAGAWAFMSKVAVLAEAQGHHPEWFNAWNRVEITLTTHDAGGLSDMDIALAKSIDALGV